MVYAKVEPQHLYGVCSSETNFDIEGKFSGDLFVQETLTIKATANISGDVIIGKLSVEPGATFNASCSMKGAIKELNQNEQQQLSEKTA